MNKSVEPSKAYILCRYAEESSLYTSWLPDLKCEYQIVEDCPVDFVPPDDCGIVITHEHFRWEEAHALRKIYEQQRIPVLVLADGVIEFRNTWQNPTIPAASIYQPLLADKIACVGNNSARIIASWGNSGKTEVVGLPRLDHLIDFDGQPIKTEKFKLLVATANTPAFTDQQRNTVLESLRCLKNHLETNTRVEGRDCETHWRLSDGLYQDLGVDVPENLPSLIDTLKEYDAVITTPSTIYLESALLNRPTAILDFSNSPQYFSPAWNIGAPEHIPEVLKALADPMPARSLFQRRTLQQNLRCDSPAGPRMVELVQKMVEIGRNCRLENRELQFPTQILDPAILSGSDVPDIREHYDMDEVFASQEVARLKSELSQAIHRLGTLPGELNDKNSQISQLQSALDESRRRVADVRARLFKLRKILGIGKENQIEDIATDQQSD